MSEPLESDVLRLEDIYATPMYAKAQALKYQQQYTELEALFPVLGAIEEQIRVVGEIFADIEQARPALKTLKLYRKMVRHQIEQLGGNPDERC